MIVIVMVTVMVIVIVIGIAIVTMIFFNNGLLTSITFLDVWGASRGVGTKPDKDLNPKPYI